MCTLETRITHDNFNNIQQSFQFSILRLLKLIFELFNHLVKESRFVVGRHDKTQHAVARGLLGHGSRCPVVVVVV